MNNARFIVDPSQETAFNMAADQYLLHRCTTEDILFIRFYTWKEPSITIGYMQDPNELLDFTMMRKDSVHWIRRPTGGRAVLHWEDLTYSCIFPKSFSGMGSSVKESYALITKCLAEGLRLAGIESSSHDSYDQLLAVKREVKLPCFLAPNRDEIMVHNRKLVGSAQKRVSEGILQHGSIPFSQKFSDLPDYLNISHDERMLQKSLLKSKSICINELLPGFSVQQMIDNLMAGFSKTLNIPFTVSTWSEDERNDINKLAQSFEFYSMWMNK